MKMKKPLALVLTAAMCIGTFAAMPASVSAEEEDDKYFRLGVELDEVQMLTIGEDQCFPFCGWGGDGWIIYPEITDVTVLSGSDIVTVTSWDGYKFYYDTVGEGEATIQVSYELPEEKADYTDPYNGCVTINCAAVPFDAYFGVMADRDDVFAGDSIQWQLYIDVTGADEDDFTCVWSAYTDEDDAEQPIVQVDPDDPTMCTVIGPESGQYYYVVCEVYYGDWLIGRSTGQFYTEDSYYKLVVDGYNEEMQLGDSCVVTAYLYYCDTENRNGVKVDFDADAIYIESMGCNITNNGDGTFTIEQTDSSSYVDFHYAIDEDEDYWVHWGGVSDPTMYDGSYTRLAGSNRYETAVETGKELLDIAGDCFDNIVIASGTNFPDALAGCPLASQLDAPILLAGSGTCKNSDGETVSVNSYAYDFIDDFAENDATIWILGGESAVPEEVEEYLTEEGYTVNRLSGDTRYDTDMQIVNAMDIAEGTCVVVVRGYTSYKTTADAKAKKNPQGYADSLSISGIAGAQGMPIFLADKNGLNEEQLDKIEEINPDFVYIIGGESAVSADAEKVLLDEFGEDTVVRIAGSDRYDTSVKVAEEFAMDQLADTAVLACGTNFPDGLTGGVLAAKLEAPVLLVDPNESKNAEAEEFIADSNIGYFYVSGGENAVSSTTVKNFAELVMMNY